MNNTRKYLFHVPIVFVVAVLVVFAHDAHGAPTSGTEAQADNRMDGKFLLNLGKTFNKPLLKLIGKVFIDNEAEQTERTEKKLTELMCRLHPCTEWGAWTECPVYKGKFSMVTRSRACNKTTDACTFYAQTEFTTQESKVCEGVCPFQYNITNGFCLKMYTTGVTQSVATKNCQNDGGHIVNINSKTKEDAVHALLRNHGYTRETIWVNGKRTTAGGPWEYTYGSSLSYDNWHGSEPSNGSTELCKVEESNPRKCSDRSCTSDYIYICEVPS